MVMIKIVRVLDDVQQSERHGSLQTRAQMICTCSQGTVEQNMLCASSINLCQKLLWQCAPCSHTDGWTWCISDCMKKMPFLGDKHFDVVQSLRLWCTELLHASHLRANPDEALWQ